MPKAPFMFGIYPFGAAGTASGIASGPPDDMQQIGRAITELSSGKLLIPRTYVSYGGKATTEAVLAQIALFARGSIRWDIVLRFQDAHGDDLTPWLALIRTIIQRFGNRLEALQITSESNLSGMPASADGAYPNVRQALRQGVLAARQEIATSGASVKIGFSVVPGFDAKNAYWSSLMESGSDGAKDKFPGALDYVGYDIYPDVFGPPIPLEGMASAIDALLRQLRNVNLPASGIPASVPIRITENGWPNFGPGRTEAQQAQRLKATVRAIYGLREKYNVTHYELFGLRDANSAKDDLFHRFGIVRDDYSRKPAFATYQKLISELSTG